MNDLRRTLVVSVWVGNSDSVYSRRREVRKKECAMSQRRWGWYWLGGRGRNNDALVASLKWGRSFLGAIGMTEV